jgi:hypothetical protein
MEKTVILIPVNNFDNGKDIVEKINGTDYNRNQLVKDLVKSEDFDSRDKIRFIKLNEFATLCNEQQIDLENNWIAIVDL